MTYNFETFPNRLNSESVKWRQYGKDVLPMWVADMDFQSPPEVIQALEERARNGVFGYPMETPELRETVVQWLQQQHSWKVAAEDILFVPGVITGFNLVSHAISKPGDAVLVQTPAYPPFLSVAEHVNLTEQIHVLSHNADGTYSIDFDTFEASINDHTRVFMLCNPQNPTGRVFRKDELEKMAEICLRHGILICSDEIHADLVYSESKHIPIASLSPEIAKHTVTLMAPSKTFNIAGLEASFAVIQDAELRKKFHSAGKGILGWINLMGLTAMQAAYQKGAPWLKELQGYLQGNRDFLYDFIKNEIPAIRMVKPEGTYLAWIDCRQAGIPGDPCNFFLEKAHLAVNDGARFGKAGEGFIRLNFGCPRSLLKEGLQRMKDAIDTL